MKVLTVAEMMAAEQEADAAGWSYAQMMESAGKAVADAILSKTDVQGKRILVLVGAGNNGGDGLVAGRYLAQAGGDVVFYLSKGRNPQTDSNYAQLQQMGLLTLEAQLDQRQRVLRHRLNITDILIDALLGTGFSRSITGDLARLLTQVKAGLQERQQILAREYALSLTRITQIVPMKPVRPFVVAVDCPSGMNCNTGSLDPLTIPANMTVTFAAPKQGHFLFPGAGACGELLVADIGISPTLPTLEQVNLQLVTADLAQTLMPARPLDGHKGTFGKALICAGEAQYWGAPVLAGRAALRTGVGIASLAVPQTIRATVASQLPEATFPPMPNLQMLDADSANFLANQLNQYNALLIGPGLGKAQEFILKLLELPQLPPLVIDADGLNVLANIPNWHILLPHHTILTPHPGEMARLMGISAEALAQMDRLAIAQTHAREWNQIVLLKGAYTVIASPDGRMALLPFANPAMAIGGSGDVLAGILVALLAQGVPPYEAALLGGYLHGAAAHLAAHQIGSSGLLAREIADCLPRVCEGLR